MPQKQYRFSALNSRMTKNSSRGLIVTIALVVTFAAFGVLINWNLNNIKPFLTGTQMQVIAELRDQNFALQIEIEKLKNSANETGDPSEQKIAELMQRINLIEQHQNAMIEAMKGPQPAKAKHSMLDESGHGQQAEATKLALVGKQLREIENTHITLAKTLTERSEKNTRMLTLMLATVSDRLVPQKLFGKAPTGSKHNIGGPFIPLNSNTINREGFNPNFPEVVTTAIETMQNHARLYNTLINLPLARPLTDEVQYISGFGTRTDPFTRQPAFHAGIDLKQNPGSPIVSTGNGVVVHAGPADGYGNMVEVAHADGVSTRYGHMSRISVSVGDPISTGQKLGTLGNTGRSTGAHLHYETRIRDQAVNPIPFLQMGERLRMLEFNRAGKPM